MKKTFLTLVAGLSVATAVAGPVLAQPYGAPPPGAYRSDGDRPDRDRMDRPPMGPDRPGGWDLDRRIAWTQERINRGRQDGSLNGREFMRVQTQLNRIRRMETMAMNRTGGRLEPRVRADLQNNLDRLNGQIRWLRSNDDRRPW